MSYGNYPNLSKVRRTLVIKLRHHGDVLLTSPLFSNLKKALPEGEIDVLLYRDTLPMLEGHPAISQFHLYDKEWKQKGIIRRLANEISLLYQIRKKGYDLVINLTEGDRGAITAWASRSPLCLGYDPGKKGFFGKAKIYTHLVKPCPHPRHTVEKHLDALRRIGIFPKEEEKDLLLHIPTSAQDSVLKLLTEHGASPGQYILIHPASRWRFKCLSTQQMAELILALQKKGETIVISSGPEQQEVAMVDEILSKVGSSSVIKCAGKLSLKELSALILMSKGLICVDSLPLHIASCCKTPVVVAFGPTSDVNWGPWMHPRAKVITKQVSCRPCYQDGCGGSKVSECLQTIPIDQILFNLERILY